jgi:catechol 2,3-dioxygenase
MALTGVLRPGFIQLRVLDMKEALVHYRDRIGLDVVSEEADGRVYLKAYDEFDRHSVILREADKAGIDYVGFKVRTQEELDGFDAALREYGLHTEHVPADEQPGLGRRVSFEIPSGHRLDLYTEIEMSENGPMVQNPDVWHEEPRGMRAIRFDHCLLYGPNVAENIKIFTEILGFSLTEYAEGPDGGKLAVFLSCSNKAHDIAFVEYPEKGKFHHASFLLESWNDVGHAADIMTRYDISVDIGPTRHGITRGRTIYFFDPSGNRNEVFALDYHYYPDNPTRHWDADQTGKSIFYYERQLNDRFLTVVT